jgi:hypothetical protein
MLAEPLPLARAPLPPLTPPLPGERGDTDAYHAALWAGLGRAAPTRHSGPLRATTGLSTPPRPGAVSVAGARI